jgi:hypothetical protein
MSTQLIEALGGMGGIAQMAKELGIDEKTVAAGAAALAPAVMGGFKQQATAGGLDGLVGMLSQMGGGSLLDSVLAPQATPTAPGEQIVGQIFGGNSDAVASHAAGKSGLPMDLIQKMLPMVAMAAAGMMAKSASAGAAGAAEAQGGLGGLLGQVAGMLGGGQQAGAAGGLGGLAAMLDMDGDGNPLDDIMGMAQKMTR